MQANKQQAPSDCLSQNKLASAANMFYNGKIMNIKWLLSGLGMVCCPFRLAKFRTSHYHLSRGATDMKKYFFMNVCRMMRLIQFFSNKNQVMYF